ncbi:MAG: hypothetical protein U1E65_11280 [Myxococcota bacterium]
MPGAGPGDFSDLYPDIPLNISVHDVGQQEDPESHVDVGPFCGLIVQEYLNGPEILDVRPQLSHIVTFIGADSPQLKEIESNASWPVSTNGPVNYAHCRHWKGEDCTALLDPSPTAEWNAIVMYRPWQYDGLAPYPYRNGDDVHLGVMAVFAKAGHSCGVGYWSRYDGTVAFDRLSGLDRNHVAVAAELRVHLGEAGLPRFDSGWVYGDLHYHSQGTDNEGESAYSHRAVLQAMRVMGLDFTFATDHASDSPDGQVTDADDVYVDNVVISSPWPSIPLPIHTVELFAERIIKAIDAGIPFRTSMAAARDMHDPRYRFLVDLLNDPATGANAEVGKVADGPDFAPQLFQGGEVDVVPEVSLEEATRGRLIYGYDFEYRFTDACFDVPPLIRTLEQWTTLDLCQNGLVRATNDPNRWSVYDIQVITDQYHARQHMLHLPTSADPRTFVSARTSQYGGATRLLPEVLATEYAEAHKGITFLAHPSEAPWGNGLGRLGPDIIPYSVVQLESAFASEEVLGLELWNEDPHRESTDIMTAQGEMIYPSTKPQDLYKQIQLGAQSWDRMLQWGLTDSRTQGLRWLAPGEPRRVFMAGGSDAHGDLNYRRLGRRTGVSSVVDSAIGKPRNLVYVGQEREVTVKTAHGEVGAIGQGQITTALRSGNFSVTDGPAIRIVIDTNHNGRIDEGDVPMGGVADLEGSTLPLIVEWKSTLEFRKVLSVSVYLGVSDTVNTMVYASEKHGIYSDIVGPSIPERTYLDAAGGEHVWLRGGYMDDPSGALFFMVPTGEGMSGQRAITLDLAKFPVGRLDEQPGTPGKCTRSPTCNKSSGGDTCEETCDPDGPPTLSFLGASTPLRVYARAFARTTTPPGATCAEMLGATNGELCVERLAFSNPVWARQRFALPGGIPTFPIGGSSIPLGGTCTDTAQCGCSAYCAIDPADLSRIPTGTCQERHKVDGDCASDQMCLAGSFCQKGFCVSGGQEGDRCDTHQTCASGLLCASGVCQVDFRNSASCR